MTRLVVAAIEAYQRAGGGKALFSVDCDFEPSCSEFARIALIRHGLLRGGALTIRRLFRCNRRDDPGKVADPVP